jgi:RNA polymerase sigma factor (sigma-70 family)
MDEALMIAQGSPHLRGRNAIDEVEDAVQHALLQALRLWPRTGVPHAPDAWLFSVARNHVLETWRRQRHVELAGSDGLENLQMPAPERRSDAGFARELSDDELAFLFFACHPVLPAVSRVAFALRHVCGLDVRQIASGLLMSNAAVAQRLVRARTTLAELRVMIEPPAPDELPSRLESVRTALFVLFNEGYSASGGETLCTPRLCEEAVRHALAPSIEATDWSRILDIYDLLCAHDPSPIVALGRAVALSRLQGPRAALEALADVRRKLPANPYVLAAAGRFHADLGEDEAAQACLLHALRRARTEAAMLRWFMTGFPCRGASH